MSGNREMPKPSVEKDQQKVEVEKVAVAIEVVAQRAGFCPAGMRRKPGDKFQVASMKQVGSWMKCVKPEFEAQRKAKFEDKAKKKKLAGF